MQLIFHGAVFKRRRYFIATAASLLLVITLATATQAISVRLERWIELRNFSGSVTYLSNGQWRPARTGQRIGRIGQGIRTGGGSLARLSVDTDIGFISVSENTDLRIASLTTTPRGGKVTKLEVLYGQARLFIRPFVNPDSSLELRTPAGVNGVRGTEFGVSIQPTGRTGVATLEGSITTSAADRTVVVSAGQQTLLVPGEPPLPPVPLTNDTTLRISQLQESRLYRGRRSLLLRGWCSPYNLLQIDGETQTTDREGNFEVVVPVTSGRSVQATVITPLGIEQVYELAIP